VGTGSGGIHYYYRWPEGLKATQASLLKGLLDIRCNGGDKGGYVLAAGSVTDKGPYRVEDDLPIRDCPPWLIERCRDRPPAPRVHQPGAIQQPGRAAGNFQGLYEAVLYAVDGDLNNSLLWASRAMMQDGAPVEDAIDLLAPAYVLSNGRGGQRQAEQTIRSGYRLQQQKGYAG
jgi:hypothetical protein